jgi:DNA-binding NtrC family response regulator
MMEPGYCRCLTIETRVGLDYCLNTMPAPDRAGRRYTDLLGALNKVLAALSTPSGNGSEETALHSSFEAASQGFGAEKALLLVVEENEPVRLRSVLAIGPLSPAHVAACERGESVRGVSPSVIRRVIATGEPELIEDPRLGAPAARTASLEGGNFSVLCAPVRAALSGSVLAVLYFQNGGLEAAYDARDLEWLKAYSTALGTVFGWHLERERRERELSLRLESRERPEDAPELVGESRATRELRRLLHETYIPALDAERPDPILIAGERGVGKDLVARYLHAYSTRGSRPFVAVNCAELTDDLAASRLFGHKKGSFTGAASDEPGLFRAAQRGVLFLDEIGDLSPRAQACLLRVLENHAVSPVGEAREFPVDVAVILATNQDLAEAVGNGRLRADFYDRFRTQVVQVPPMRERRADVPLLLEHFRSHHERRSRKRTLGFTEGAYQALLAHDWPGNVRDIARTCSLFVTHATAGAWIDEALLERCRPDITPLAKGNPGEIATLRRALKEFRRDLILSRIEESGGRLGDARRSLGLSKATFHRYLAEAGIVSPRRTTPTRRPSE